MYKIISSYYMVSQEAVLFKPSQIHRLIDDFPKLLEVRMYDLEVQPGKFRLEHNNNGGLEDDFNL